MEIHVIINGVIKSENRLKLSHDKPVDSAKNENVTLEIGDSNITIDARDLLDAVSVMFQTDVIFKEKV